MRYLVFHVKTEFGKCLVVAFGHKDGVVTEALCTALFFDNAALHLTFEDVKNRTFACAFAALLLLK